MVTTSGSAAGKDHSGKKRDDFSGFLTIEGLTPAPKQAGINSYMSTILLPLHPTPTPREGNPKETASWGNINPLHDKPTRFILPKDKGAPEAKDPTSGA